MISLQPRRRTGGILLLIPISFAIAVVTQNIQTVLFVVSVLYLALAGLYLAFVSGENGTANNGVVAAEDFVLRRGGAWGLILFVLFITWLLTLDFVAGIATAIIVYAGGVLDQASVHREADEKQ